MSDLSRVKVCVLGVPDSAGAYCVGVEQAPAALRAAGLIAALVEAGADVSDAGDLTQRLWKPDRIRPLVQNLDEEIEAVLELEHQRGLPELDGDGPRAAAGGCSS